MPPVSKGLELLVSISLHDHELGSLINIIYEHPEGISLVDIRREENKKRKQQNATLPKIFHKILEQHLTMFLKKLVDGEVAYQKDGLYHLVDEIRTVIDGIMEHVRKHRPELFALGK